MIIVRILVVLIVLISAPFSPNARRYGLKRIYVMRDIILFIRGRGVKTSYPLIKLFKEQ